MLIACWSTKGGVGTTVVAAGVALHLARCEAGVVLADLAGDVPAVLGLPEPPAPGLAGWLAAGARVPADALARIEVEAAPGLAVLPRGPGDLPLDLPLERAEVLAAVLDGAARPAVVDCGRIEHPAAVAVARRATRSLLVVRPCFMALRRACRAPLRATGVVVIVEPGRVLSSADVATALDLPLAAEVPLDPQIARLVDAGLLAGRVPRGLQSLREVA